MKKEMLFNRIPYEIRDEDEGYMSKEEAEKFINKWTSANHVDIKSIESVFTDNSHCGNCLHVYLSKDYDIVTTQDIEDETGWYAKISFETSKRTKQNIVKQVAKELGMTYKELAIHLGYSEGALKTAVSTDKVSSSMEKAISLYLENRELKEKLQSSNKIKQTLKEWLK